MAKINVSEVSFCKTKDKFKLDDSLCCNFTTLEVQCFFWVYALVRFRSKKTKQKKTLRWGLENIMFRLKIPVSVATNRPEKCPEVSLKNTQSCNHKHSCRRHSFMLNINGFFCHHRRRWKMSWGRPKIFGDVTLANAETAWLLVKTLVSHLQIP